MARRWARRPNAAERLLKWCRRKPALAAAATAVLAILTVAVTGIASQWLLAEKTLADTYFLLANDKIK